MKTLLFVLVLILTGALSAQAQDQDDLIKRQKTLLIIAAHDDLPKVGEQLDVVNRNEDALKLAHINVYLVTPKRIKPIFQKRKPVSFNLNSYRNWIDKQHNFNTVLINGQGVVAYKSANILSIQDIFTVFDRDRAERERSVADTVYAK